MLLRDLNVEVSWNFEKDDGEFNDLEEKVYYKARIFNVFEKTASIQLFISGGRKIVPLHRIRLQPKSDNDNRDFLLNVVDVEMCLKDQDGWIKRCLQRIVDNEFAIVSLRGDVNLAKLTNIRRINSNPTWNPNNFKYYRRQLNDEQLLKFSDLEYVKQFCLRAHAFHARIEKKTTLAVIFYNKRPIIDEAVLVEYFPPTRSVPQKSKTQAASTSNYNKTDLLKELECPVCMNEMQPPIRMCVSGHSICTPCKKRLSECPICRKPFTDGRNFALESLAMKLSKISLIDQVKYVCGLRGCNWRGVKEELTTHWSSHNLKVVSSSECDSVGLLNGTGQETKLMFAFKEYFWLKLLYKANAILYSVQYIGSVENARKFSYRIEIGECKSFIMQRICEPIDVRDDKLFTADSEYCMIVSFPAIKGYVANGSFKSIVKIMKN